MRFESLLWTLLAVFLVGGSDLADTLTPGPGTESRYESADGGKVIPPPLMDGGTSTTTPAQFTK